LSLMALLVALAIWLASPETIVGLVDALGRGPRLAELLLYLHGHTVIAIVPSVLIAPLGIGATRRLTESRWVAAAWTALLATLRRNDRTRKGRLAAVLIVLTPLAIFTHWFVVIHGTFTYDDLDILAVIRTAPLLPSLLLLHGDAAIPLFRVFFAAMYATFGVHELYWNLYSLLLMLTVNVAAVALLVRLGTSLLVSALFYVTVMSAGVWNYVALGYYSMSIYQQIGLLGLLGVLAVVEGQDRNSAYWLGAAVVCSALAPFIHPSGAYVPMAVGAFALVRELGRSDAGWSPLRMLRADYRFFTFGLLAVVAVYAAYLVVAVRLQGGAFLSMAHSPLSPAAVAYSLYLLLSQGMALPLLKPLIGLLAWYASPAIQGALALAAACVLITAGAANVDTRSRWTFFALLVPSVVIVIVVSLGRRLASIEDVTTSAGKYNGFAYLWFLIATFYLAGCLVAKIPPRWKQRSAVAAATIAALLFVRYAVQDDPWLTEGPRRRQQQQSLISVFAQYADRQAPAQMHIPTLDGAFIWPHYNLLFTYNLSAYRPFFGSFDQRLTLLRNQAMDPWGREATKTVSSLRQATDPAFVQALEADQRLQELYLGAVELRPKAPAPLDRQSAVRLDEANVANATSISARDGALTISTTGGASLRLIAGDWDPETNHVLTLRVVPAAVAPEPGGDWVEVTFSGDLPFRYAPNRVSLPQGGGDVSIDLLQLYSYALNPRVRDLGLRFPRAGGYTISDVHFGR